MYSKSEHSILESRLTWKREQRSTYRNMTVPARRRYRKRGAVRVTRRAKYKFATLQWLICINARSWGEMSGAWIFAISMGTRGVWANYVFFSKNENITKKVLKAKTLNHQPQSGTNPIKATRSARDNKQIPGTPILLRQQSREPGSTALLIKWLVSSLRTQSACETKGAWTEASRCCRACHGYLPWHGTSTDDPVLL